MQPSQSDLQRPANPTWSDHLADEIKSTNKSSERINILPMGRVADQQRELRTVQPVIDAQTTDWNTVHCIVGSFADEHSTL